MIKTQDDPSIIGVVYNVFTEPLDPSRRPIARGPFQNEPEKLYEDNPHLSLLFRTQAEIFILGHIDRLKSYKYELPLLPAKIHTGISLLDEKEILAFTSSRTFMELLQVLAKYRAEFGSEGDDYGEILRVLEGGGDE